MVDCKGNVLQIVFVGLILLVSVLCAVFALAVLQGFSNEFYDSATASGQKVINAGGEAFKFLDLAFLLFGGLLFISFLVSAFFVRSNPAFFAVNLLLVLVLVVVGGVFEDVAGAVSSNPVLLNETSTFSKSFAVLENQGLLFAVFSIGFIVILYAGWSKQGGGM